MENKTSKGSPIKSALQRLRLPKSQNSARSSSPSPVSEARDLGQKSDSDRPSRQSTGSSTSEWELPELSGKPQREPAVKEKVDTFIMVEKKQSPETPESNLDPKVAGVVLFFSLLLLWRPSFSLLLILLAGNILLGCALVTLCMYIQKLRPPKPSATATDTSGADVKSTVGLQQLLSPGWTRMRSIIKQRDFRGLVTAVDLGEQAPQVTFVQSEHPPCDGVVCYNIGLNLSADSPTNPGLPYVQISVKVPGYSNPWIFQMKLLALDITVQLYFWSLAPEGRGSGRPYDLIEAALCTEPSKHVVKVALEAISESPLFESILSRCEPIASAVICSHVLPRFSGFENRVVLEEGPATAGATKTKKESTVWQQSARRAGWQPRAEAAVESVAASAKSLNPWIWQQRRGENMRKP